MTNLRPEQMDVSTGSTDNDTVTTKGYVDDAVAGENLWDRVTGTPNYLLPHTAADDIGATGARITKGWFTDLSVTNLSLTGNTITTVSGDLNLNSFSNDIFAQNIRPATLQFPAGSQVDEISTTVSGSSTNAQLPTALAVWNAVQVENIWDRVTGIQNYLKPYNAGDTLHLNEEENVTAFATSDIQIFRNASPDTTMWAASATASIDANLNLVRSRGTIASPAAVQDNDLIGNINLVAVSGIAPLVFTNGAEIRGEINGAVSAGVLPCDMVFYVNAGAGVATEGMRLVKDKKLAVDYIHELTGSAGVIIEDLLIKDELIAGSAVEITADSGTLQLNSQIDLTIQADNSYTINPDQADADLTIKSTTDAELMFFDMGNDRIGISTNTPTVLFDIAGDTKISSGTFALASGGTVNEISTIIGPLSTNNQLAGALEIYTEFAYLNGKTGGQTLRGGFASGEDLDLESTGHATKGEVRIRDGSDFTFVSGVSSGLFKVEDDADGKLYLGRAKLFSAVTDVAYYAHYDNDNATDYAIKQLASGRTSVNAKTGQLLGLAINNVSQVNIDSTKASFVGYINQTGIFAEIYVADASAQQLIPTGVTYTKSTAFTTDGQSSNCTADAANDKITITQTGRYRVSGSCSAVSGTANVIWRGAAFLNGVEQSQVHWKRKMATNTDAADMSFTGFIDVTSVPWDLDLRLRHDNGAGVNFTIEYANLNVEYVGAT
jgi:hypothetical protein